MPKSITILNLSDLHFGRLSRFKDANISKLAVAFAGSVKDSIRKVTSQNEVDLVMVTGDIAESGIPAEFDQGHEFLKTLSTSLSVPYQSFVFVPGNHDVSWPACIRAEADQMELRFDESELRQRFDRVKLENYRNFVSRFYEVDTITDVGNCRMIDRESYVHDFEGLFVSVAALNSCERESHRNEDHRGHLGDKQAQALMNIWRESYYDDWLKIILVHHNPMGTTPENQAEWVAAIHKSTDMHPMVIERYLSDIVGFDGRQFLERIIRDNLVQLVLHGHHHQISRTAIPSLGDGFAHVLSVGSFGLEQDRIPGNEPPSCQIIELKTDADRAELIAHSLVYDGRFRRSGEVMNGAFIDDPCLPGGYRKRLDIPRSHLLLGAPPKEIQAAPIHPEQSQFSELSSEQIHTSLHALREDQIAERFVVPLLSNMGMDASNADVQPPAHAVFGFPIPALGTSYAGVRILKAKEELTLLAKSVRRLKNARFGGRSVRLSRFIFLDVSSAWPKPQVDALRDETPHLELDVWDLDQFTALINEHSRDRFYQGSGIEPRRRLPINAEASAPSDCSRITTICQSQVRREIESRIGPKYIKELYVNRSEESEIREFIAGAPCDAKSVDSLQQRLETIARTLIQDLRHTDTIRFPNKQAWSSALVTALHRGNKSVRQSRSTIEGGDPLSRNIILWYMDKLINDHVGPAASALDQDLRTFGKAAKRTRRLQQTIISEKLLRKRPTILDVTQEKKLSTAAADGNCDAVEKEKRLITGGIEALRCELEQRTPSEESNKEQSIRQQLSTITEDLNRILTDLEKDAQDIAELEQRLPRACNVLIHDLKAFSCSLPIPDAAWWEKLRVAANGGRRAEMADLLSKQLKQVETLLEFAGQKTTAMIRDSGIRDVAQALTREIRGQLKALRPAFVLVDRAGGGKTNLCCRVAETNGREMPTLFLYGKFDIAQWNSLEAYVDHLLNGASEDESPITLKHIIDHVVATKQTLVIVIDAINESLDPPLLAQALRDFFDRLREFPVKVVVTCRDLYWRIFTSEWWNDIAHSIRQQSLYEFSRDEWNQATRRYFRRYRILASLSAAAEARLRHPLMLRFFCEAFRGKSAVSYLGRVEEIRRRELFGIYCERKFREISDKMEHIDSLEVEQAIGAITKLMVVQEQREVDFQDVAPLFGGIGARRLDSLYSRILDEDVVLEEKPDDSLRDTTVSFVYDEFMEYFIATDIIRSCLDGGVLDQVKCKSQIKSLVRKSKRFVSAVGILEYLLLIVADDHQVNMLPELWELGPEFREVAVRTLQKISPSMFDDQCIEFAIGLTASKSSSEQRQGLASLWRAAKSSKKAADSFFALCRKKGFDARRLEGLIGSYNEDQGTRNLMVNWARRATNGQELRVAVTFSLMLVPTINADGYFRSIQIALTKRKNRSKAAGQMSMVSIIDELKANVKDHRKQMLN